MRTVIVTSAITFVPENYDQMILGVADHPSVVGLIILENREISQIFKALFLILTLASPGIGWHLLKNYFGSSNRRRKQYYQDLNKKVWILTTINDDQVLKIIKDENIDLIVNARTRFIYKENVLSAPRLGCINIHHGLLPVQRGLMCDFWAHLEKKPFGFTIHQMTRKIDDGAIIEVVRNPVVANNFLNSIFESSKLEAVVCKKILTKIVLENKVPIHDKSFNPFQADIGTEIVYRKNPRLVDGYRLQLKGVRV